MSSYFVRYPVQLWCSVCGRYYSIFRAAQPDDQLVQVAEVVAAEERHNQNHSQEEGGK
jgi:hypothetical protein